MGLLDDMRLAKAKKGPPCEAGNFFLTQLTLEEREDVRKAFHEESIPMTTILQVLNSKKNSNLKIYSLRRHIKGECDCGSI